MLMRRKNKLISHVTKLSSGEENEWKARAGEHQNIKRITSHASFHQRKNQKINGFGMGTRARWRDSMCVCVSVRGGMVSR